MRQVLGELLKKEESFRAVHRNSTVAQRVQLTPLKESLINDHARNIARCISYSRNLKASKLPVIIKWMWKLTPSLDTSRLSEDHADVE